MRLILRGLLVLFVAVTGVALYGYREARADPVVRRARVALPEWPVGAAPVTVALMSDIHIGNAVMDGDRLSRIVARVNALHPDVVLIAGDFIDGHDPGGAARMAPGLVAPLRALQARHGVVAVLGNHDHWTGAAAVRTALKQAGVAVLENQAVARGPIAVVGIGDLYTHHADVARASAAAASVAGAQVLLTHTPDLANVLPARRPTLLLGGHTHCGQGVVLGRAMGFQPYDPRYRCGVVRRGAITTIVTAGLGTSQVPMRIGAPPDLWLLTLGPAR